MTAKRWFVLFISFIILCLLAIVGGNYFIDPFGYFRGQDGECDTLDENYYMREIKAQHIRNNSDEYTAYVIGGSKAGALRTDKLEELDGNSYYNTWVLSGNFQDYYYYTKYIIKEAKPKKILLHISTTELKSYSRETYGDIYEIPAVVKGESKTNEVFRFLFKNLSASMDELKTDRSVDFYPLYRTGERNLTKYYNYLNEHPDTYYHDLMEAESTKYLNYITDGVKDNSNVISLCLNDLKEIQKLCSKNDVELQVIMAPVFIGELVRYEGPYLYEFMEQLTQITGGFWCFNNLNDYALNPFNFYNTTHYYYESGDLMVDAMKGEKTPEEFGIYLTMDNIGNYIRNRKAKYEEIKNYYKKNGTLPLKSYDDPSTLMKESKKQLTIQHKMDQLHK